MSNGQKNNAQGIEESGMTFGPYAKGACFRIDGSSLHTDINSGDGGIKIADFIVLDNTSRFWIIEAKTTSPKNEASEILLEKISAIETAIEAKTFREEWGKIKKNGDFLKLKKHILSHLSALKTPRYNLYITEIIEKFQNTLNLFFSVLAGRRSSPEIATLAFPKKISDIGRLYFCLVINGSEKSWLPDLQDALETHLKVFAKTWNLGNGFIKVFNHEIAKEHGLISAFSI
jgi:hypothetical protein